MKKPWGVLTVCSIVLIGLLDSCVSVQDRPMSSDELASMEVLSQVKVKLQSYQPMHIILKESIKKRAYNKLLKEAQRQYQGKVDIKLIDIKNIDMRGGFSAIEIFDFGMTTIAWMFANWQTVTATGDVVVSSNTLRTQINTSSKGLGGAVNRSAGTLVDELPKESRIAIISISSKSSENSEFVLDELEFQLVKSKAFTIVERKTLDTIRAEQNFQMSGAVDDKSAVSIGTMLGATIVITGTITGSGSNQRLTLKALDVKTAQIVTMIREQF